MEKKPTIYLSFRWYTQDYKVVRVVDTNMLKPGTILTENEKVLIVDSVGVHVIIDPPREREHVARRQTARKGGK